MLCLKGPAQYVQEFRWLYPGTNGQAINCGGQTGANRPPQAGKPRGCPPQAKPAAFLTYVRKPQIGGQTSTRPSKMTYVRNTSDRGANQHRTKQDDKCQKHLR
eukprot:2117663-Rhodomonas_salina.2